MKNAIRFCLHVRVKAPYPLPYPSSAFGQKRTL
jgi:hypothetical protein